MYLIHHFIVLRPLVQFLVAATICAWLGMWYCALRLCAYHGWKTGNRKVPFVSWVATALFANVMLLPGMAVLIFVPSLLQQTALISSHDETKLLAFIGDLFYSNPLVPILLLVGKGIHLIIGGEDKPEVTTELVNPFTENLEIDEIILWSSKPAQPYFARKSTRRLGYVLAVVSLAEVVDISLVPLWPPHEFVVLIVLIVCYSLPLAAYAFFRIVRNDATKDTQFYAITNQHLRKAELGLRGKFTYSTLRLENLDFARTIKSVEAKGIETIKYLSSASLSQGKISFECIEDADTVEVLVRVAYEECTKAAPLVDAIPD